MLKRLVGNIYTLYYKNKLFHCGKNVVIQPGVIIHNPQRISIGDNVELRRGCILSANDGTSSTNSERVPYIKIGSNTHIKEYACLTTYGGFIKIGSNSVIGQCSILYGNGGITIGSNSGVGPLCLLTASNHIFDDSKTLFNKQGETKKGIVIECNVWCGGHVTICDGVHVEKNSIIGAGSVVRKSIDKNAVVLGNPAQICYYRDLE